MELTLGSSAVHSGEAVTCSASAVVSAWYDRYGTDVLRLCYMYMRNRSDAEDALQETFLKIWRKLDCYEGRNHCTARSWIMKVAQILDHEGCPQYLHGSAPEKLARARGTVRGG